MANDIPSEGEIELSEPKAGGGRLEEARAYASDIGVLGVLRALTRLRGLILLPIIARGLGAATYGVWTQSLVFVSVGTSIVMMQLDTALVRFISGTDDRREQASIYLPILTVVFVLGAAAALVSLAFPQWIATSVLGDAAYTGLARWLGVWTGLTAVGQLAAQLQRGLHRVKLYGFLTTAEILGQLLVVVILIMSTGDLIRAVWGAVVWELVFVTLVLALGNHSVGVARPRWRPMRDSLAFSLPLIPSYYSSTVLAFADRVVIASQLGSEAVGIYAAAYSLARIVRELFTPISTALLPAATQAWDQGDEERGRWLLFNTLHYYSTLTLPALAGLSVLGAAVLTILAPAAVAQDVGWLVFLMGVGYLASGLEAGFAIVIQIIKKTPVLAFSRVTAALLYVVLVVIGVSHWGLIGGAGATGVGYLVELGLTYWLTNRYEQVNFPVGQSLKAAMSAIAMAAVVWFVSGPSVLRIMIGILVGAAVYIVMMISLRGLSRRELRFFRSAFLNRSVPGHVHRE